MTESLSSEPSPISAGSASVSPGSTVSLYAKWRKLYPLWVSGGWQRGRRIVLGALLLVFYGSPWLVFEGHPAVQIDVPGRKLILFGNAYWPQELVMGSWLLIIAALTLFVVTVFAGRVWCGWACPQTVWTLVYVWIEKWIEGDRERRLRLDRGPWSRARIRKKTLKFGLWAVLASSISFTLVGFFVPIRDLLYRAATLDLSSTETFWVLFPAALSFLFSGVLREQVCFHMCPYARFQSVMFDQHSWIISYDEARGEPRGRRARRDAQAQRSLGACVDCGLCVKVCPTGIDIRDGLQYQCIGCAACIDACNQMMDRLGSPRDLVRYSSQARDRGERVAWLRPRLVGYAAVLLAMVGLFSYGASHRVPLALDILRDRNRLYRVDWQGSVENAYTLKIMNREQGARSYRISVMGDAPLSLASRIPVEEITVPAGTQMSIPVRLVGRWQDLAAENTPVLFTVEAIGEPAYRVDEPSRFLKPESLDYVRPENRR